MGTGGDHGLRIAAVACLLCFPLSMAWARVGYVETRDGRVLEGHVRFESNAVVVVNAAKELWAIVPLTNIAGVILESTRPPEAVVVSMAVPSAGGLPNGWQSEDIGSVRHAGGAEFRRGVFRVRSSGTNALGLDDSAHFVFKTVRGRSEIVARVMKVDRTDPWAGAGLMMREGLAAGARNVFLAVTAARGATATAGPLPTTRACA